MISVHFREARLRSHVAPFNPSLFPHSGHVAEVVFPIASLARQVGEGDLATVKKLVANGVDVAGTANEWGETCLHLAAIPK